ncbi:MAG: hypothetical protein KDI13_02225 [Alphaproteobacteria bacterium]|nr:hypothetical protein [Alphaproteobacteria bacterium]
MRKFFLALLCITASYAPNAYAAEPTIDDAGAARLQKSFTEILDYVKTVYGPDIFGTQTPPLIFEGDLKVEKQSTFYSITWPHMYYQEPAGTKIDLGVMAFNAVPGDKDGDWKMTMALPASYAMTDPDGKVIKINIGAQNTVALFNESLGYFTKYDANFENITLSGAEEALKVFKIEKVHLLSNLSEESDKTLSGPFDLSFNDISIEAADNTDAVKVHIGRIGLDGKIDKFTPVSLKEYKEKLSKYAETLKSLHPTDAGAPQANIDPKAMIDMFSDLYSFNMNGAEAKYSLQDLTITSNDENLKNLNIKSAYFMAGTNGLLSDKGSMDLGLGYSNLKIDPLKPGYEGSIPENVNISLRAQKIPVQILTTLGKNSLAAIGSNPDMAAMAGMGFVMKLPAILSQAGTEVIVKDTFIKGGLYNAAIDGKLVADLNAVASATGSFNGVFEGLDDLYALAEKNAANPDFPDASTFASVLQPLGMLKAFGKPGSGPSGKPAYLYDLKLTPEGKFLINGQDLSPPQGQQGQLP